MHYNIYTDLMLKVKNVNDRVIEEEMTLVPQDECVKTNIERAFYSNKIKNEGDVEKTL